MLVAEPICKDYEVWKGDENDKSDESVGSIEGIGSVESGGNGESGGSGESSQGVYQIDRVVRTGAVSRFLDPGS